MAPIPNTVLPGALYDTQGRICNRTLLEHSRDFTLRYLRHTIGGEPLDQLLIEGHILQARPSPLPHDPRELIETPTYNEHKAYAYVSQPSAKLNITAHPGLATYDFLERHFIQSHGLAQQRGALKEALHTQSAAITVVMERVLDSAASKHADGFAAAQKELEGAIAIGVRAIEPILKIAGMHAAERHALLEEIHELSLMTAIHLRLEKLPDAEQKEALYRNYQDALADYRKSQIFVPHQDGTLHRSEQVPISEETDLERYRGQRPYTARVRLRGRDLMDSNLPLPVVFNDNERVR